jgi:hypothetical protein
MIKAIGNAGLDEGSLPAGVNQVDQKDPLH